MRRWIVAILSLVAAVSWGADWSGAAMWTGHSNPIVFSSGFVEGYFDTIADKFPWTQEDQRAWVAIGLHLDLVAVNRAVDRFYLDPENKNVSPSRALRYALEAQIAKMPEGLRLLAAIGVRPGPVANR